jgi:hypothetical protein
MNFVNRPVFIAALLFICSGCVQGPCKYASGPGFDRGLQQQVVQKDRAEYNLGAWAVSMFREYISAVDSDRCPSLPSCSSYSISAFKKHGFFGGWLMTADRLIHEADEDSVSPVVYHNGRFLVLDPVENNDFWWYGRGESIEK